MINHTIVLRCDGCFLPYEQYGFPSFDEIERSAAYLVTLAQEFGWVVDGQAHFCPACQVQRRDSDSCLLTPVS